MSSASRHDLHAHSTLPAQCLSAHDRLILRACAALAPAAERDDWRRNWRAELWHLHDRRRRATSIPDLSTGLLCDALWLRAESWRRACAGTALLCLASLAGLCAIAAFVGLAVCGWGQLHLYLGAHLVRFLIESPLVVVVTIATSSRRYTDQRTSGKTLYWIRRQLFFAAKAALLLALAFLLSTDLCLPPFAHLPMTSEVLQVFSFELCAISGLMWALRDQDQRCKRCLCALSVPAQVGRPSHNLLEWTGTQQACRHGHGILTVPEMLSSWRQHSQWAERLDLEIESTR